jgi:hypothetical protein
VTASLQPDDDTTEAAVRVGRTLRDKWHLDTLIDVGGMAAVYAATHRNGMRGAVKILHRHRSLDADIAARFRREGYIANKVAHPNAVTVLDDDVDDDGSVFLVMELLEGTTLRERAGCDGTLQAGRGAPRGRPAARRAGGRARSRRSSTATSSPTTSSSRPKGR